MKLRTLLFALLAVLIGIGVAMRVLVRREHERQVGQLAARQAAQSEEAVRSISAAFGDLSDALKLSAELIGSGGQPRDHERELRAILEAIGQVKAIGTYGAQGQSELVLLDRHVDPALGGEPYRSAMESAASAALQDPDGRIATSPRIEGAASTWLRAMALRFETGDGKPAGAVAILVDTEPLFAPVRVLENWRDTEELIVGPNGRVAHASAAGLERDDGLRTARMQALLEDLRAGRSGQAILDAHEAAALGLGSDPVIAVYRPLPIKHGAHWALATLTSTSSVEAGRNRLLAGLAAAALLGLALLGTLGGYVMVSSRRAVELRESRRVAERLAQLNARVQTLLDNIPAAVLALTPDRRISVANRVVRERVEGLRTGSTLPETFSQASPESLARLDELIDAALEADRVQSLVAESLELFGAAGHYTVHAVPLPNADAQLRALLVLEDLSIVRALESQLVRAEKLATVGILAAGIAHEIGTPLGVIRGRAEYVQSKLADPTHASNMQVIIEQIDRVTRTLRQLLDFARMQPAPTRGLQLDELARSVQELLRLEAERRNVRIELALDEALPQVLAEPDQLQQVLINLVVNALDACEAGGTVTIRAARETSALAGGPWVVLAIQDTGVGIPEQNLHRVFDPFFTTKKRGQGTGLGLTIVAQIVRNHGGLVEVESGAGQGTRITVRWPAAPPASEERHAER